MFKIMQALLALHEAALDHDTYLDWTVDDEGGTPKLVATIPITEDDAEFVDQMRKLLGVAE